jgi:predicted PurR-regulated permease PerM
MTDPDIQAVVQHATAQAESLYPKRTFSIRARLAMVIILLLLVGNTVLSVVNASQISQEQKCQTDKSNSLTTIRNQDQTVIDNWINHITDQLEKGHLTHDQFVQQAEALRQQYNQDRANNSTQRTQLNKTNCK